MPKKKSKKVAAELQVDVPDNASVVSVVSDGADSLSGLIEADEVTITEKLSNAIDELAEKRPETRVKALKSIITYLRSTYLGLCSITWNHSEAFLNGIEFIFKKGRTEDRALAAECLAVMSSQYDADEVPIWLERFKQPLDVIFRDNSEPCIVRGKCATALASLCFFANCDNYPFILQYMNTLESVFRGSCPKGDGKALVLAPAEVNFHLSALQAWTLLLTMLPIRDLEKLNTSWMPVLINLLKGSNMDVKIVAGEAIAIMYERIRIVKDSRFRGIHYRELSTMFEDLTTDCDKSKSKDDRKRQRQSFRDIMSSVLHDEFSETNVRFGTESMQIMSCTYEFYYNFLCDILAAGLNQHLRYNYILRDLFDLGPPKPSDDDHPVVGNRKANKSKRNYENQCAFKLRTQMLNIRREKRTNALAAADDD